MQIFALLVLIYSWIIIWVNSHTTSISTSASHHQLQPKSVTVGGLWGAKKKENQTLLSLDPGGHIELWLAWLSISAFLLMSSDVTALSAFLSQCLAKILPELKMFRLLKCPVSHQSRSFALQLLHLLARKCVCLLTSSCDFPFDFYVITLGRNKPHNAFSVNSRMYFGVFFTISERV